MNLSLECVFRTRENSNLILSWRSDEHARAMSTRTELLSEEEYWNHFSKAYFLLKELPPLFAVVDGKRVGFVGFDPVDDEHGAMVSIVVAKDARGNGVGSRLLKEAVAFAKQQGCHTLYAIIKDENRASIHIFEKAGFTKSGSLYKNELVPVKKDKVFIIAEAGSNWRAGSKKADLDRARDLINVAKEAGCDAVKFQVYRADTVYVENAASADYMDKMGIKKSVRDVFVDLSMPYEMIGELAAMCKAADIEFMATPFSKADFEAVDPYVRRHKIGSYEIGHVRLLELAKNSKKPLILSTGAATVDDIAWAVAYCGGKDLTLLQCCAQYPAKPTGMNLRTIPWMSSYFGLPVGLSDHTVDPVAAPTAAVALGATVIEKHFTMNKSFDGPDHSFALEPNELKMMVSAIRQTEQMLGHRIKRVAQEELELFYFARRGLQAIKPIKTGDLFVEDGNVAILRPGKQKIGVHPRFLDELVGKKATRDIPLGDGVQQNDWK